MKKFKELLVKEAGASYLADKINIETLLDKLKSAFCEEMNAWYQYIIIAPFLIGNERSEIAEDYLENAKDELEDHGYWILERINQLGGDFHGIESPTQWNIMATHKYITPYTTDVKASVMQMIEAEKGAIETYEDLEAFTRDRDVVTNRKIKEILGDEQEHLQEMEEFLDDLNNSCVSCAPAAIACEPCEEPAVEPVDAEQILKFVPTDEEY